VILRCICRKMTDIIVGNATDDSMSAMDITRIVGPTPSDQKPADIAPINEAETVGPWLVASD
jgi:hypothetical protein